MNIVKRTQTIRQKLFGNKQMAQVSPRIITAGITGAVGFQRAGILPVFCIRDVQGALWMKNLSIAGIAGGQNTIEHISSQRHQFDQIFGRAGAHDILWFSIG